MPDRRDFLKLLTISAATVAVAGHSRRALASTGRLMSISAMTIAADRRLILADWRQGALLALNPPAGNPGPDGAFNLKGLNAALEAAGALPRVSAMVWDAEGRRVLVAVPTGTAPDAPTGLAAITADGAVVLHDPAELVVARHDLVDRPGDGALWRHTPVASLTVTDMVLRDGELIVAGLSNADFAATLRRVPWPFAAGSAAGVTRVEMYHTVHNQFETRAPVRAMAVVPLDGTDHLLAAYTCTPLVTAPLADLKDGASVRAKTIAELGYGNTPLRILPFVLTSYDGTQSDWVLVANATKAADLIPLSDIAAANARPGIAAPVKAPFETTAGLSPLQVPLTGVVGLSDQGPEHLIVMRRESMSGELELVSIRKGAFFRLSDHVNEYDFPTYDYPAGDTFQQNYIRPFHAVMRSEEGYPDLVE
ncbi:twin-arginine translocation signal domain-containing protein [Pannonibacter sp. SL95]|uniref:twin-arginine translocation signal domain-containing protein n=1 Tax=Pannonibacter sp. SL95 TaxID=2995153 RepID=UPI002274E5DE|nr:twin-arginine translocation signal domain-containing protein [Pannonibacter sp. SL95]MCY1707276.1 twin-arginine translocation signal domain-containing protein [Pannonibacter sp. SL95]